MKPDRNLIIVSFLILFLELLLIRFIGTEIRIFAYLSNLLLLGIFIGSGLGMFLKRSFSLVISSVLLLLLVLIIVSGVFINITDLLTPLSESFIWFQSGWNSVISVIGGIAFGENRAVGYSLIGIGLLLAVLDIIKKSRSKNENTIQKQ